MVRRMTAGILAACMLLVLCACGGQQVDAGPQEPDSGTPEAVEQASAEQTGTTVEAGTWSELLSALKTVPEGGRIVLSRDITDAGQVDAVSAATAKIDRALTLDGSGHSVTAYQGGQVAAVDGGGSPTEVLIDPFFAFEANGAQGIVIRDLVIDGASYSAKIGGGMAVRKGAGVELDGVVFRSCFGANPRLSNGGGAIYMRSAECSLTARNCVFDGSSINGGETGRGGAVYLLDGTAVFENCSFTGNRAAYGGAIAAGAHTDLTLMGCTFAADNAAVYGGDDIYLFDGYTFRKDGDAYDSSVTFQMDGCVFEGEDGETWQDYRVVRGRVLGSIVDDTNGSLYKAGTETPVIEMDCAGSGESAFPAGHDLTFDPADYNRQNDPAAAS